MRDGICPKCGGSDIRIASSELVTLGQPYRAFGAFVLHEPAVASPTAFICISCGYMEHYMLDGEALQIAAEKWPSVQADK